MSRIYCILLLAFYSGRSLCDSPVRPLPRVTVSNSGELYFAMIPKNGERNLDATKEKVEPFGIAYELLTDGKSKELWRVSGWYSHTVFLSNDGEHLVRLGTLPFGEGASDNDLAVAFYKNGSIIKSYSTNDLVKDKSKIEKTSGRYIWFRIDEIYARLEYTNNFHLKTIDGVEYIFDLSTGDTINP